MKARPVLGQDRHLGSLDGPGTEYLTPPSRVIFAPLCSQRKRAHTEMVTGIFASEQ